MGLPPHRKLGSVVVPILSEYFNYGFRRLSARKKDLDLPVCGAHMRHSNVSSFPLK